MVCKKWFIAAVVEAEGWEANWSVKLSPGVIDHSDGFRVKKMRINTLVL